MPDPRAPAISVDVVATGPLLLTIGHSTHPAERFIELLRGAEAGALVDIRIGPGSRRNPQFQRAALEELLSGAGIGYRWEQRLGGFRRLPADSPDTALRNDSFRAYAAHMRTTDFRTALDEVLGGARAVRTVIMCSESVWWRCHRRLVSDAAELLHGWQVRHVMPDGRLAEHRPTSGVRVAADALYYDVA